MEGLIFLAPYFKKNRRRTQFLYAKARPLLGVDGADDYISEGLLDAQSLFGSIDKLLKSL
jgi:hypothetical protein